MAIKITTHLLMKGQTMKAVVSDQEITKPPGTDRARRLFVLNTLSSATAATAVATLAACGGSEGGDGGAVSRLSSSLPASSPQIPSAAPSAGAQTFSLAYQDPPVANPLKGFVPYGGDNSSFPHSMQWFYIALKDIQTDYEKFDWTNLEARLSSIADRGYQAAFRVYLDYPQSAYGVPAFLSHVPKQLYTDHGNGTGNPNNTSYSPDYTHVDLRRAIVNFIKAFGEKYDKDPRIGFITAGLLGFWGEWHTYTGSGPSVASIPETLMGDVLDAYKLAFPSKMILARGPVDSIRQKMQDYTRLGFHDDSFALSTIDTTDWHFWPRMQRNGLDQIWKTRPMGGEVFPGLQGCIFNDASPCTKQKNQNFDEAVKTTHASWLMSYGAFMNISAAERQRTVAASQLLGYTLHVSKATLAPTRVGQGLRGTVSIENRGVAPFYYPWTVELAAVDSAGKITKWAMVWDLRTVLPGEPKVWAFDFSSHGLPAGSYTLVMGVANPMTTAHAKTKGLALKFANATQDKRVSGWLSLGGFAVAA
jgi:Domain of unknown function (DUF4832)